jgi:prevent-host-death family protein
MTRVKIAELKNNLSKHLRAVERGASIEITDRDRPIAHLIPASPAGPSVRIVRARIPFSSVRGRRYRPAAWRVPSLDILLEDRRRRR